MAFFRSVGEQNPLLTAQMSESARFYKVAATWLDEDPVAPIPANIVEHEGS